MFCACAVSASTSDVRVLVACLIAFAATCGAPAGVCCAAVLECGVLLSQVFGTGRCACSSERQIVMSKLMSAVVKSEPKAGVEFREVPIPAIGPADVLVKVKVASICGTDLHIYNWDPWAQGRIAPPLIPGHEFCGHVAAIGNEVTSVKEGDFVSAEMHVACGKCLQCRTGQGHICQNVKIIGIDQQRSLRRLCCNPRVQYLEARSRHPARVRLHPRPPWQCGSRRARRRSGRQDGCHHRLRPHRPVCHRRGARLRSRPGLRH